MEDGSERMMTVWIFFFYGDDGGKSDLIKSKKRWGEAVEESKELIAASLRCDLIIKLLVLTTTESLDDENAQRAEPSRKSKHSHVYSNSVLNQYSSDEITLSQNMELFSELSTKLLNQAGRNGMGAFVQSPYPRNS
ncbi:hypothetical protein AVEN_29475-1 [Araneus ventricosus]|uniref:Uncharacterized protein n=1 Tax=Araneus ventricosus TaxID=182803 RepID=A0A4Y2XAK3_ARAVE|nr:hypothetical protein AVEN_29475-1 [Araneus ventricosus]